DDGFIKLVAADAETATKDDSRQGNDRNFASTAADIDNHVAGRLMHGQPNANRRGHRLFDQINLARASVCGGIFDGPFFHFRDAGGDGHHDPRSNELAVVNLLDEMPQHRFGDLGISNQVFHHLTAGGDFDV